MAEIVVAGSLNLDTTARVGRLPTRGETVLGTGHATDTGGKGANQAVAAARLGRSVSMVGRVGQDAAGRQLTDALTASGVDTAGVSVDDSAPTGMAFITVEESGENMIVVSPGANATMSALDIERSADLIAAARVLLLQLEVPLDAVHLAAALCRGTVILNPAPAADLPADLLTEVDILVPNRTELAALAGGAPAASAEEVARQLDSLPVATGIVTLGPDGALVRTAGDTTSIPAPRINAVDATAAGDAFCGALGDALARGEDAVTATRWGVAAGAAAASRPGAQASLPRREDVEALL